MSADSFYTYLPDGVTFTSTQALGLKTIYMPLCGRDTLSLKSAITPFLSGDIKIDKFHYLTKPASREDLRMPLREFFVYTKKAEVFSLFQESSLSSASVEIGPLWHKLIRRHKTAGLEVTVLNFVPVSGETVELMHVHVKNTSKKTITFTPTAATPLFGRSLANKHDHEQVTALLNRAHQMPDGVFLQTTMAFNEEGHKPSHASYFVYGCLGDGKRPLGTFPTVDSFYGDQGSLNAPQAVYENHKPQRLKAQALNGKETLGALRFKDIDLAPGQGQDFIIAIGTADNELQAKKIFSQFNSTEKCLQAWALNQAYWREKISSIEFVNSDTNHNSWMRWVTLQPILRRIYGCSFLPDHDYGKGGRGWRDIWQDLLSLILIEPHQVRQDLINNCAGIRIDGSNATIIGARPGEFVADRNAISRVWMDHGAWPFLTLLLYIDQSGDFDILFHPQVYFRDPQLSRTKQKDTGWVNSYGHHLLDKHGKVYEGTILEHILVTHLTQFFNVGEHNMMRLEGADWNDGLDMAHARGESVAFSSFYAGNLFKIAELLEEMAAQGKINTLSVARELLILMDTLSAGINYDDYKAKQELLFNQYFNNVQPVISGETIELPVAQVAADLKAKGQWLFDQIRRQEKVQAKVSGKTYEWFNGYYDNQGQQVEGNHAHGLRMTLTGQVFAIMSGMATSAEIEKVILSVDQFLKDPKLGGYRLNTDFGMDHYLDMGRAFGFAYGTKENGAFFSHMNVMYASALYQRGFARAGYNVLQSIYKMAIDGGKSKIYPGIPEYFDAEGRGMYHYLTGSASWLVLTQLLHVFGVRGFQGDLILAPQLVKEEFNKKGIASVSCQFAGKRLTVQYHNPQKKDAGKYSIKNVLLNFKPLAFKTLAPNKICIQRAAINENSVIEVLLA